MVYTRNVIALILCGAFLMPVAASAQSLDEIRAQLASVRSSLERIESQIVSIEGVVAGVSTTTTSKLSSFFKNRPTTCLDLRLALRFGMSDASANGEVSKLQKFLSESGLYGGGITGFFGPQTQAAVEAFQAQYGVVATGTPSSTGFGALGPQTRAAIREFCKSYFPPRGGVATSTATSTLADVSVKDVTTTSHHPYVRGRAKGAETVDVRIASGTAATVYSATGIKVRGGGQWTHRVSATLDSGSYTITLSIGGVDVKTGNLVIKSE